MKPPTKGQMARMQWGWRLCSLDLTSQYGFRWASPGNWAVAPGPCYKGSNACPPTVGNGICIAHTLKGATSGGQRIGLSLGLLVGYLPEDVLADSPHKLRVRRAWVLDIFDPSKWLIRPQAGLRGVYLRGVYLPGANLSRADLSRANLSGANLSGANLGEANLGEADLVEADLRWANLRGVDLHGANLRGVDLHGTDLRWADLGKANLSDADLRGADLRWANLKGAHLEDADLGGAKLSGPNLHEAIQVGTKP